MRRLAAAMLLVLAALALAACGSDDEGGGDSPGGDTIKIGAWFPLTGETAAHGIPQREGASVAFEEINAEGGINGKQVEYITEDNAFDPQKTIQAARTLDGDGVAAIVSANGTAQTAAAFPYVLDQAQLPIINTYGGEASWYEPPKDLLWGYQTPYGEQAGAAAAWAAEEGHKDLLLIREDVSVYDEIASYIEPGAQSVDPGASVNNTLTTKFGATADVAPLPAQVKSKQPDAVILLLSYPVAAAYLKEAQLQGLDIPTYGIATAAEDALIELAGDASEGFRATTFLKPALDPGPEMSQYRESLERFAPDEEPSGNSAASYGAVKAFAQVVEQIKGDVTSESINEAFEDAGTIETGILPPLTWSADQHLGTDQVQRVEIKNGKFIAVGEFIDPPAVER